MEAGLGLWQDRGNTLLWALSGLGRVPGEDRGRRHGRKMHWHYQEKAAAWRNGMIVSYLGLLGG